MNESNAETIENYVIFNTAGTPDTLEVNSAELQGDYWTVRLGLADYFVHGTEYTIVVQNIMGVDGIIAEELTTTFMYTGDPIAVLLGEFSADLRGDGVELSWRLSEDTGDASFLVLREESGASGFVPVGAPETPADGRNFKYLDDTVEPGGGYAYRVEYSLEGSWRVLFETDKISVPAHRLALYQNHPNPFNPSTTIAFDLPEEDVVWLSVYDVTGRLVRRLYDGRRFGSGHISCKWDGRNDGGAPVASGVYYYKLRAGRETRTKKMVLLR